MKPIMRRYQSDEDYWRIRQFLREVHSINNLEQKSWEVARFDYWRWHGILNMNDGTLEDDVFIWETSEGQIAAVLNREAPGSVFLQLHSAWQSSELEAEMLDVASEYLAVPINNHQRQLHVWVESRDREYKEVLASKGYVRLEVKKPEVQRRCILDDLVTVQTPAPGYQIRSIGDVGEHEARGLLSFRAFHPDEAPEKYKYNGWYGNIQRAPLYRRDLDLVAVAPSGELAAFCTVWFDDVTRTGLFEPVGTAPEHQRRGLGKAVLTEALYRLQRLGAKVAFVGSYTDPAHALYASVGFEAYRVLEPWVRSV